MPTTMRTIKLLCKSIFSKLFNMMGRIILGNWVKRGGGANGA
jgi:hypothetical protein